MESCSSIEKKLRWVLPDRMAFSKANPTSPVSLISSSIRFTGKEDVLDIAEYNRFGPIPSSLLLHTGNTCPIMKRVTIGSSSSLTSLRKFETFVVISREPEICSIVLHTFAKSSKKVILIEQPKTQKILK